MPRRFNLRFTDHETCEYHPQTTEPDWGNMTVREVLELADRESEWMRESNRVSEMIYNSYRRMVEESEEARRQISYNTPESMMRLVRLSMPNLISNELVREVSMDGTASMDFGSLLGTISWKECVKKKKKRCVKI